MVDQSLEGRAALWCSKDRPFAVEAVIGVELRSKHSSIAQPIVKTIFSEDQVISIQIDASMIEHYFCSHEIGNHGELVVFALFVELQQSADHIK